MRSSSTTSSCAFQGQPFGLQRIPWRRVVWRLTDPWSSLTSSVQGPLKDSLQQGTKLIGYVEERGYPDSAHLADLVILIPMLTYVEWILKPRTKGLALEAERMLADLCSLVTEVEDAERRCFDASSLFVLGEGQHPPKALG